MTGWFFIKQSYWGPYYQVRVRDASGNEDTVAQCHTLAEAQHTWDRLVTDGLCPRTSRPTAEPAQP